MSHRLPEPKRPNTHVCGFCKCEVSEGAHGWIQYKGSKPVPCPVCTRKREPTYSVGYAGSLTEERVTDKLVAPDNIIPLHRNKQEFISWSKKVTAQTKPQVQVTEPPRSKTWICHFCRCEVNDTDSPGWTIDPETRKPVECPVCTPPVALARGKRDVGRFVQKLVADGILFNAQNFPSNISHYSFALYPRRGNKENGMSLGVRQKVEAFARGELIRVFLWGMEGRGKSGLALAAARMMLEQGMQVLFLPSKLYFDLLQQDMYSKESTHRIKFIAMNVEVLILDDLGTERVTDSGFSVEETQALIDYRYAAGLPTLITSNFDIEGLKGYWWMEKYERAGYQPGKRLASRISGHYTIVEIRGPDLRKPV